MKTFPVRSCKTDKYMDYVYKPYAPAVPVAGKYASENFFIVSAGRDARLVDFAERLREGLGRNRIVYGVKKRNGKMYWELYFYNYEKNPELLIENIRGILSPDWTIDAASPEKLDYMMFSFELDEDAFRRKRIDCLHCYTIFNVGKQPYSACYLVKKRKAVKENLYIPIPLDSARRISVARAILRKSFSAGRDDASFREFMDCSSVCFARKGVGGVIPRLPNAVYFSGLRIDSLIRFLRMFGYPASIVDFACGSRHKLDHLLYDIGFDIRGCRTGQKFTKSGFYGII